MTKEQYKEILKFSGRRVIEFLSEAMIDEIGTVVEIYGNGMSLTDWEELQEAIEEDWNE